MAETDRKGSRFPETSLTLLGKLAVQVTGEDEANWLRFWNLYAEVVHRMAAQLGDANQADDITSEVFRKLVEFFRGGRFDKAKGNFRGFLAQMIRNEVGMAWRKARARREDRRVYLDDGCEDDQTPAASARRNAEVQMAVSGVGEKVAGELDLAWAAAQRQSLEDHLFANPAVKPLYRDVARAFWREGRSLDEVQAAFALPRNTVCQIKCRMEKALAGLAAELGS